MFFADIPKDGTYAFDSATNGIHLFNVGNGNGMILNTTIKSTATTRAIKNTLN